MCPYKSRSGGWDRKPPNEADVLGRGGRGDRLPASVGCRRQAVPAGLRPGAGTAQGSRPEESPSACGSRIGGRGAAVARRSEEHTSELQSLRHLVCRLLLEKKKNRTH